MPSNSSYSSSDISQFVQEQGGLPQIFRNNTQLFSIRAIDYPADGIIRYSVTFTKSLAQILSRAISFYDIVATRKGYFNTITLTVTLAINPTLTPTHIPTLTLTQAVKNEIFV